MRSFALPRGGLAGRIGMNAMQLAELKECLDVRHGHVAAFLDALGPERAAELARRARIEEWRRGDLIFADGEVTEEIAFLVNGAVGMSKRLPGGQVHIVGLLGPGDMFGRLGEGPLTYRVEALSDATVLAFERTAFEEVVRNSLEAERLLLVAMMDELDATRDWLLLLGGHSVAERLAGFLLVLMRRGFASRGEAQGSPCLHIPLKRVDLAHYLGVRPESLSRAFRRLQDLEILEVRTTNSIEIIDISGLIDVSGQDLVLPSGDVATGSAPGRERKRGR